MSLINYREILTTSWSIAWRRKYLWLFGLFVSLLAGAFSQLNDYLPKKDEEKMAAVKEAINYILDKPLFLGAVAFIMLAAIIIQTWSRAALIKTADLEDQGISSNFFAGSMSGKKYFGQVFIINFLVSIFIVGLVVFLFVPAVFVVNYAGAAYGMFMVSAAILILVLLAVAASFVRTYALIYAVASGLNVVDSMERAYQILRDNIKSSLMMLVLLTLASLAMGMFFDFIAYFLTPAYIVIGRFFSGLHETNSLDLAVGLKYSVNTAILFLFLSIFGVFQQISWIRFFRQIAGKKTIEAEKEKEGERKELPEPEGANLNTVEK